VEVGDRVCTRGRWARNGLPRVAGTAPSAGVEEVFGHRSQTGFGFGVVLCGTQSWSQ